VIYKKKALIIIPARGGSKRIKNKNIKNFVNKPLIEHTINYAYKNIHLVNRMLVSTDSEKIQKIANNFKKKLSPFLRPKNISKSISSDYGFVKHSLNWLKLNENFIPEIIIILRPTTPLRKKNLLKNMLRDFTHKKYSSLRSARNVEHMNPFWMYKISKNKKLVEAIKNKNFFKYYQTQKLPNFYKHDGYCDIFLSKNLRSKSNKEHLRKLYGHKMGFFINDDPFLLNIDTMREFKMGEIIYKAYRNNYV